MYNQIEYTIWNHIVQSIQFYIYMNQWMESVLLSIQLLYVWCTKSIAQVGCWKNPCAHTCYCCYIANQTGCRCPMELSQFYNYGPSCSLGVIFPHTYLWYQIKDSVCLHWGEKDFNYVGKYLSGIRPHFITHVLHPMNPLFNPHPMTPSFTFKRNFHVLCAQLEIITIHQKFGISGWKLHFAHWLNSIFWRPKPKKTLLFGPTFNYLLFIHKILQWLPLFFSIWPTYFTQLKAVVFTFTTLH